MLNSYKELKVWQKSINLVEEVYDLTSRFPKEELYGLVTQMRRAAISIPSNIAEGQRRKSLPEYLQFLRVAGASSAELETQIIISKKIYPKFNYFKTEEFLVEVPKMLNVLLGKLNDKNLTPKTQNLKPNQGGQLLIESGIAISILIVSLLGILGLLSRSLGLNNVVSGQYIASGLATEGIEVIKNLIDANIIQFKPWNQGINSGFYEVAFDSLAINQDLGRFLLFDSTGNDYNYQTGQPTFFKRVIEIKNIGADEIKVNSKVNWQIKGGSYSVNLEDHFFNWRP